MADMIQRQPEQAAEGSYDLIVVGGGVYGVCLALEAARRGLRPQLLERDDFGGATSWNSLRILHGGLRYLQTLDLPRFRESVAERRWFCRHMPDLVEPLRCVMPLYGRGLKRASVFRVALKMNDILSRRRNDDVRADRWLGDGQVLDRAQTLRECPMVTEDRLEGAGVWHDVLMPSTQRVVMELLRWACACGAVALNYAQVTGVLSKAGRATGVVALERQSGQVLRFEAPVLVNAAGPWVRPVARHLDQDVPHLFEPTLAFNVLLDVAPPFDSAMAVQPPRPGGRVYFVYPLRGRLFAGTFHAPWHGGPDRPEPSEQDLQRMIDDLSDALPGVPIKREQVLRVHSGLLPAARAGSESLSVRDVFHDHGRHGGLAGLYSVSGVKFTTARAVAERILRRVWSTRGGLADYRPDSGRPSADRGLNMLDPSCLVDDVNVGTAEALRRLVAEESVVQFDDLWLRRTDWDATAGGEAHRLKEQARALLAWDGQKTAQPGDAPAMGFGEEAGS